jgi:hypothetical protein
MIKAVNKLRKKEMHGLQRKICKWQEKYLCLYVVSNKGKQIDLLET